jgi:polyribonucleotide nucleotidyltransferase
MYKLIEKKFDLGDGRSIVIETGKLAKQADGSVVVRMGKPCFWLPLLLKRCKGRC